MPNVIKLLVENPDEILNPGSYGAGAVIRLQTSATQAGTFADVTGTGSTPTTAIVTAIRSYTGYDPSGTSSSWYRSRFENVGATRLSDWTPAFQVGDETAGLLCSLYDVKQELGDSTVSDELILEKIRQVSFAIEHICGRWLAPRPTDPNSTMTLLFDVPWTRGATRSLLLVYPDRTSGISYLTGIRTLTSISLATQSQPDSGGTYTSATAADFLIRGMRLEITPYPTGSPNLFYPGYNTVQITGSFGPASVPLDLQGVALRAAVRRVIGKGAGALSIPIGPEGTMMLLPDLSGADKTTLGMYTIPQVA